MTPRFRKVALIAASLGLLLSLFLALRPDGEDDGDRTTVAASTQAAATSAATTEAATTEAATTAPPAGPTEILIAVVGGRPEGGIQHPKLAKGERAVLVVTSDVADEVHFHGYDLSADVEAGGTARIPFTAAVPGRFEVELEERGVQLADVEVGP